MTLLIGCHSRPNFMYFKIKTKMFSAQIVPTKLEAHDCPRCLGMLKLKNVLSLKVRGLTQPIPLSIFRAHTMQSGNIFWHPPNANSPIRLPNREAWFVTPQNRFPLLQSSVLLTLGIVLDYAVLTRSCSAMETHFMKLPPQSFSADIKASESL